MTNVIQYGRLLAPAAPPPAILFQGAVICWFLPLVLGVATYLTWLKLRVEALLAFGPPILLFGALAAAAGVGLVLAHVWKARRCERSVLRRAGIRGFFIALLLLGNFAVASVIVESVTRIATNHKVCVTNTSSQTVRRVRLVAPGVDVSFGPIGPGQRATSPALVFDGDGSMTFEVHRPDRVDQGVAQEYVTGNMGGSTTLTIGPDDTSVEP